MKNIQKQFDKIRMFLVNLASRLRSDSAKSEKEKKGVKSKKTNGLLEEIEPVAYQLVGERTERLVPIFKGLDENLKVSGLKVNFKAYISVIIFAAVMASIVVLVTLPFVLFLAFNIPFVPALLFGIGGSLFSLASTIIVFYGYPIYRADTVKRQLEDELPFTTGYMAILTSAGVSPENVFTSLSNLPVPLTVSSEAKDVMRNVNLFGSDIISALAESSKHTPSESYRELLEGFISTIHSGGNLTNYLRDKSTHYMKLKRIGLKKYSDTLSMLSEFYVAILLTGPLMLVIMLTVMAMLGGGNLGIFSPDLLLNLLTYIGIPLGAIVFLIILDASSPKW